MTPPARSPRHRKTASAPTPATIVSPLPSHAWGTADEVAFLVNLGTGHWTPGRRPRPRTALLRQYRAAMTLRQDWGTMNTGQIGVAVARMLQEGDA